jgi:tetratricopeptide (TPR) repeat protein
MRRDLLVLMGFLRAGKMYPAAVPVRGLPTERSLKAVFDAAADQERLLFAAPSVRRGQDELRQRGSLTSWSGEPLPVGTRISEVPDPGVVLCLLYDTKAAEAPLPIAVFAQTLRRFALRDPLLRAKFDQHLDEAGTFVPAWLSPEVRRQRSQEAFDTAMRVARDQGFAHAAPLLEGVRGECFSSAQVAISVYEMRELGDMDSALKRLNEVVRVAPRHVAARMQRARLLMGDSGRRVEAAADYLSVLRECGRLDGEPPPREVRDAATAALWDLCAEFRHARKLEAALTVAKQDSERGFELLSRYVYTHPCAWDGQMHLAVVALARQRFDLAVKLLAGVRWLFPDDPNPHFVYGQALAMSGPIDAALRALEYAEGLSPGDVDIRKWVTFARDKVVGDRAPGSGATAIISVAHHVARSALVLIASVRKGRVSPTALMLHKLPGDVSLLFVLQSISVQEQRRGGLDASHGGDTEVDLRAMGDRCLLTDYAGEPLSLEQTVGDVPDPGVIVAVFYENVERDDAGRPAYDPTPDQARRAVLQAAQQDTEISFKLQRHMKSPDASLRERLEMSTG